MQNMPIPGTAVRLRLTCTHDCNKIKINMKENLIQLHIVESLAKCLIIYSTPRKSTVQSGEKRNQTLRFTNRDMCKTMIPKKLPSSPLFPSLFPLVLPLLFSFMAFYRRQKPRRAQYTGTMPGKVTYCTYIFHMFSKISVWWVFCMNYSMCLAEHPSLYPGQLHKDILPSVPAETSHRKSLLQKSIPCSEQL